MELNLTPAPTSGCGCGCSHDADLPTLDAREIPHAIRHGAILGAIDQLQPGAAMALIAPHDPKPLLAQIEARWGEGVEISYLEQGPEAWKLRFARR